MTMPRKTTLPISSDRGGITTSATPERRVTSPSCSSAYCFASVRAWSLKSRFAARAVRDGNRRSPNSATIAIVPITSGTPTSANSKNPKRPTPASAAASDTITFTGVPVSASSEPACAPNASGSSNCDGDRLTRTAITTTTGTSAATAPLTLISAVSSATSAIVRTISRDRLSPADAISFWPAHAVTPVASSASLTTNSEAMKITVGSPKPASACCRSSTPVAHSASATPIAVIAVGMTPRRTRRPPPPGPGT